LRPRARHDFASRLEGVGLRAIGELLGHTQAGTALHYVHASIDDQRRSLKHLRKALPEPASGAA